MSEKTNDSLNNLKINLYNPIEALEAWNKCLAIIKQSIGELEFKTWFDPFKAIDFDGTNLKVQIPNRLFWDYIEEHYIFIIKNALYKVLGHEAKLTYEINEQKEEQIDDKDLFFELPKAPSIRIKKVEIEPDLSFETYLNEIYTFDNFVEGKGNLFARGAALSISENPGKNKFNPFFLYGGVGLGKTHLAQAIGNEVLAKKRARRVRYITAEQFLNDYVDSIKKSNVNAFSGFYREIDVLIVDDIQFLSGKEATADTFFHIFNSLHQLGKQIILTSDKPPKNLNGLDERLISRFQWGLSVDIQPPDLETRMAILQNKCQAIGLEIDPNIIEYIAINITSNIRELEGCLSRLLAMCLIEKKEISLDLTKEIVSTIATVKKSKVTIDTIKKVVAEYFGIEEDDLIAKIKKQEIVYARQIAMYFCKKLTQSTLKTIGLHFGGRDHTTVMHSVSLVEENLTDKSFIKIINEIQKKINFKN